MPLSSYDDELNFYDSEFSIKKVYSLACCISNLLRSKDYTMRMAELLWEREEKPIEMTVAEIEKKLGIKNLKIVKE